MADRGIEVVRAHLAKLPPADSLTVAERRAQYERAEKVFPVSPDVVVERVTAGAAPAEWLRPPSARAGHVVLYLHGGGYVQNWDDTVRFYREVLGFKPSDWMGNAVAFLRCGDRYHHSAVLIRSPQNQPVFDHFCIQVESIDDVMRFRHNAVAHGVALRDDVLRHGPSGSISVYIKDEARGFAVEYCTGHPQIDDETHEARVLPMVLESVDIWRSPLPEPRITEPAPALDRLAGLAPAGANGER